MDRSDGDIEFFEVLPGENGIGDDRPDVVDVARLPHQRVGRWAVSAGAGLAVAALVATVIGSRVSDQAETAPTSPPGTATSLAEAAPVPPGWAGELERLPSELDAMTTPTSDEHCPADSTAVQSASSAHLVVALDNHLPGFVVDRAGRLVNQRGELCTAYLQAHDRNGVSLLLLATGPAPGAIPIITEIDYGPPDQRLNTVSMVTAGGATILVLAQGPGLQLPTEADLSRLAADPGVLG